MTINTMCWLPKYTSTCTLWCCIFTNSRFHYHFGAHSSWNTEGPVPCPSPTTHKHTQTHRHKPVQKRANISLPFLICRHNATWHTRTRPRPIKGPSPGNLFQPICAAVRVRLIVSCVCNVSAAVIGKSFETLKSLFLVGNHLPLPTHTHTRTTSTNTTTTSLSPLLLSLPTSLAHCQTRLRQRSISRSFHLHASTSHTLARWLFPSNSRLSIVASSLSRISLQPLCLDWRLPLSWWCWHTSHSGTALA